MSERAAIAVEPHELELQQRFVTGDGEAMGILVRPHMDVLYTLALRLMGSPSDAEDCVQDALVLALRKRHQFTVGRPLRPWLLRIVRNQCLSRLRSPWWRRMIGLGIDPPAIHDTAYVSEALDRDARVRRVLMTLPQNYREALALFHLEDMTYAEMSAITGVQVPALKQRVRRGSALLRDKMAKLYPEFVPERRGDR